jgi:pimeloyl-ACP methyl ester carboxylesterase
MTTSTAMMIEIDGATIHVERTGRGEPPLVFVHGMCGGAWVWSDQVGRLSAGHECVAYDRRGHTRSSAGSTDHSTMHHAGDLVALIAELELDRPVIVGSSSGALITLEALHRSPELARGAVLSEPPLFSIDADVGPQLEARFDAEVAPAVERDGMPAATKAFLGVVAPGLWEQLDEQRRQRYRDNAELLFASLTAPPSPLTPADLARITVPTCVVAGRHSVPLRDVARAVADTMPNAEYVEFADANHATYVQAPAEFAATVEAFATSLR